MQTPKFSKMVAIFQDGNHFYGLLSAENQDSMMLIIQGNKDMDLVLQNGLKYLTCHKYKLHVINNW